MGSLAKQSGHRATLQDFFLKILFLFGGVGERTPTYILAQNEEYIHYPRVTNSQAGACLHTLVNIGFQWILCFLYLFSCLPSGVLMTELYMLLIFLCMLAGAHDPYLSIWFGLSPIARCQVMRTGCFICF